MCMSFFFFFKQKTAYEMRISDWSSDVCSSDLMMMQVEAARSLAMLASLKADAEPAERAKAAAAAKVQIGKSGKFVGQQAIQLHGGMGMTDELDVGHYMKRLMMIDTCFGNAERSEEHTSELQSLMRISYAVFCLKKK